jgi:hypothetical protein
MKETIAQQLGLTITRGKPLVIKHNGKKAYYEDSEGYWYREKYDDKGNNVYHGDSDGYWCKREYDDKGDKVYWKNSNGLVVDNRSKKVTLAEVEAEYEWSIVRGWVVPDKYKGGNRIVLSGFSYEPLSDNQFCAKKLAQQLRIRDFLDLSGVYLEQDDDTKEWWAFRLVEQMGSGMYDKSYMLEGQKHKSDCAILAAYEITKGGV